MGQIISSAAKPKRCNLNQLSQLGTPAAGEYILVSSDNSMNAAGQGNFDCCIVGNGTTAASELEVKKIEPDLEVLKASFERIWNFTDGGIEENVLLYLGNTGATEGLFVTPYIDITDIKTHKWRWFAGTDRSGYSGNIASLRLEYFDANKTYLSYYSYTSDPRTITPNAGMQENGKYIRITFVMTGDCYLKDLSTGNYIWYGYYKGKHEIDAAIENMGAKKVNLLDYQASDYVLRGKEPYFDMTAFPTWVSGYLDGLGVHASSSANRHTSYIYIRGMRKIKTIMNIPAVSGALGNLCFYDENKTFIIGYAPRQGSVKSYEEREFDVPLNAVYLRTTIYNDFASNWFLYGYNEGSVFDRVSQAETGNGMPKSDNFYLTTLIQAKRPHRSVAGTTAGNILSLLHFSDIHGQQTPLDTILQFKEKYSSYINDILCTGDIMNDHFGQTNIFETTEGAENILMTIGNHDVCLGNSVSPMDYQPYSGVTTLQGYNEFIAPFVSNWGVVQPTDAATLGLNYYYKDYDNVRLIVLDCYAPSDSTYIADQVSWLSSVLSSAKTSSKAVVIAVHQTAAALNYERETGFCAYERTTSQFIDGSFVNAVQSFIDAGGEFVCWLAGHTHCDYFGTLANHPNQTQITITCAYHDQYDDGRVVDTPTADSFNIVSFDTYSKLIKVLRVGNNEDRYLRPKNVLTWDYANKKIVSTF